MPVATLLDRLHGVRKTGPESWVARCPAHHDKTPSLAVREASDGRVLVHCFAGCSAADIVESVGLSVADLFADSLADHLAPLRARFPARDVLECVAKEAVVTLICARQLKDGKALSDRDQARLVTAAARLQEAADAVR